MALHCVGTYKTWLEYGPVTADLTTTVVYSHQLLLNNIKPIQSLTQNFNNKRHKVPVKVIILKYIRPSRSKEVNK